MMAYRPENPTFCDRARHPKGEQVLAAWHDLHAGAIPAQHGEGSCVHCSSVEEDGTLSQARQWSGAYMCPEADAGNYGSEGTRGPQGKSDCAHTPPGGGEPSTKKPKMLEGGASTHRQPRLPALPHMPFGSRKRVGLGSWMEESSKPFASDALDGMTTCRGRTQAAMLPALFAVPEWGGA